MPEAGEPERKTINEFLDQAYAVPPPDVNADGAKHPVAGGIGEGGTLADLTMGMRAGVLQYGNDAYAVLLNPVDKHRLQMQLAELEQKPLDQAMKEAEEAAREGKADMFMGRVLVAAMFVDEGTYLVIGLDDYKRLLAAQPS